MSYYTDLTENLEVIHNKYFHLYCKIIDHALSQNRKKGDVYYESHHILPKSIFLISDLVLLSAKEHFVVHHLLTKFTTGKFQAKMWVAFSMFCRNTSHKDQRQCRVTSRVFENARIKASEISRSYKHSTETRAKISKALKGHIKSPEWCRQLSIAKTGKPGHKHSTKTREQMSRAALALPPKSKETRKNISEGKIAKAKVCNFYNIHTKESFIGSKYEFAEKFNIEGDLTGLVRGKSKRFQKTWELRNLPGGQALSACGVDQSIA